MGDVENCHFLALGSQWPFKFDIAIPKTSHYEGMVVLILISYKIPVILKGMALLHVLRGYPCDTEGNGIATCIKGIPMMSLWRNPL